MSKSKELVEKATPKMMTIPQMIEASAKELGKALPDAMSPERLTRIALTCMRVNPELAKCTPESFMGALFTSAQLGLEPIAGRAYLLPFNNSRKVGNEWKTFKEVNFIMGYKGIISLFYRHAKSASLSWATVHENDEFDYELGTNSFLRHKPAKGEKGQAVGYWVMAKLSNGGQPFEYMTREECYEHGTKHSKTYDKENNCFYKSSPWVTNFDSQALKTVLIQLSKLLPLSVELQQAIQADESSRHMQGGIENVLELPDQTQWNEESEPNDKN
jgi:recombination protein RecT